MQTQSTPLSSSSTLSILIPVRNEALNLRAFHRKLLDALEKLTCSSEIIYIENGSSDESSTILKTFPKVTVVELQADISMRKPEKTAALKAGIDHSSGDVIATIDADLQNDPADLQTLLQKIEEGADMVVGWRKKRKDNWKIRCISLVGRSCRYLSGFNTVHDSACGMKMFRRECIAVLPFYGEWERYLPDLIAMQGFRVTEAKIPHYPRTAGVSKYPWTKGLRAFADLIGLWFWHRYNDRPLQFFGSMGIVLMTIGTAMWGVLGALRIFEVIYLSDRIWPLIASTMLIVGLQLLFFGLIADILARMHFTDHAPYNLKKITKTSEKPSHTQATERTAKEMAAASA